MKKLFLLIGFGTAGICSAQTIVQTGSSGGDYAYTYTSTCGRSMPFTSVGSELDYSSALILASNYNVSLCGTKVKQVTFLAPPPPPGN